MKHFKNGFAEGADGTSLYYSLAGPDAPVEPDVMLFDGIGCDGFVWKYLRPRLARRHRVVHWHYRGHGRSEVPDDRQRLTMSDIVSDAVAVMDAVGTRDAIFLGHSIGVQVILEVHRRHPERVRALVPVCGSYGRPLDTFHDTGFLKEALPHIYRLFVGLPELTVRLWRLLLPSRLAWLVALLAGEVNRSLTRWEDLEPYFEHLARMDPEVFVTMLALLSEHSAEDHLPHVDVPTLVVGAELDTFTPVWLARRMAELVPGAELLVVPKGSHAAPVEQPELLSLRLEKFFRERLGCYGARLPEGNGRPPAAKTASTAPARPKAESPATDRPPQ